MAMADGRPALRHRGLALGRRRRLARPAARRRRRRSTSPAARSSPRASPCPIRRGFTAGGCGCSNSGTGRFGFVDLAAGRFEPVAFCPGYARGLAFAAGHAIVGLSLPRADRTFSGLPLEDALAGRGAEPRCGLAVIDLASGDIVHWVRIEGVVRELYDVAALPGARRPAAIGFRTGEIAA